MPKNAHAHFILGLMYQRMGQAEKVPLELANFCWMDSNMYDAESVEEFFLIGSYGI